MNVPSPEIVLIHSSDLHLSADGISSASLSDPLSILREVLAIARSSRADLVLLAGDTFDHNRQPAEFLDRAAETMAEFSAPIVVLPGNHDPLTSDSVYRRSRLREIANVCVLGLTVDDAVVFPHLGLEICGKAHVDYFDMSPLSEPRARTTRWRLSAAHGHYVEEPDEPGRLLGSWLIRDAGLVATGADYVALGHWNRAARVGGHQIRAYYSGSPDYTGTVNVVRLRNDGEVKVSFAALPSGKREGQFDREKDFLS
ncbi:MAG TPA: metallophosphoesterase [Candidatus Binatia bacterium]|jgi:DNA repair exonuclease SbcCD nuclease subunit